MFEYVMAILLAPAVFWFCLIAGIAVLCALTEPFNTDYHFWPIVVTVGLAALVVKKWGIPELGAVVWACIAVAYFIVGTAWSVAKWYWHNLSVKERVVAALNNYRKKNGLGEEFPFTMPEDATPGYSAADMAKILGKETDEDREKRSHNAKFLSEVSYLYSSRPGDIRSKEGFIKSVTPDAYKTKGRIIRWIIFWPTSVIWAVIDNPVYQVANYIYKSMRGTMAKISEKTFADIK